MAYDGWLEFNGVELVNFSRTAQLATALGIDSVWISPGTVSWIETALAGEDYDDVSTAPWYDPAFPASGEFAGIIPLSFPGLDDSSAEAATVEYITDGGRSGRLRNATLPIVANVALVGSTSAGVDYGKRWMDRVLKGSVGLPRFRGCSGVELRYFRHAGVDAPVAHRRQVRLTRGANVTRKRPTECSVTWLSTFTLTCDDPYEYGAAVPVLSGLGGLAPTGDVIVSGDLPLIETACPVYDYTPIYDPAYPALVPSPAAPDLYPAGWAIEEGLDFTRYWARVSPVEPSALNVVPLLTLTADTEARMVRVGIWPSDSATNDQCDPLFGVVVSYLPAGVEFTIDAEQVASYVWDGFSEAVRRADSLVYSPDAKPVEWTAFNDSESLLITLDIFTLPEGETVEGGGTVRLAVSFVPKSD